MYYHIFVLFCTKMCKCLQQDNNMQETFVFDEILKNLSLYQFHACPFCVKIRRYLRKNSLNIDIRDAKNDKKYRSELKELGGKIQVPCLRIENNNNIIFNNNNNNNNNNK